jgi:Fic family protein
MDPLSQLLDFEPIEKITSAALKSIDELNWNRTVRNKPELIPLARRISGYASSALEGAAMPADPRQNPDESAMGKLSIAALGITAETDFQLSTFLKTPLQTWARLHSFIEDSQNRGRPRTDNEVADSLHIGLPLEHSLIEARLDGLVELITTSKAPAVLLAAIAHAELAVIAPFNRGSQMIARATTRLILQSKNIDQLKLVMPEFGFYKIGRNSYAKALIAYQSGTIAGMSEWVSLHSQAIHIGATSTDLLTELYSQPN